MHLILVKIPDPVDPVERGEKYDDPMTTALEAAGVGVMNGGGTIAGSSGIEGCYLDIKLTDRTRGLQVVRTILHEAGAPRNSTVEEYEPNGFVEALTKKADPVGTDNDRAAPGRV
jgi:hypothetical protein